MPQDPLNLLPTILNQPEECSDLELRDWDLLIRQARSSYLLPKVAYTLLDNSHIDHVPQPVIKHLESARIMAEAQARTVRWEARQIKKELSEIDTSVIVLKGGAYILGNIPAGRGRIFQDLDIMVPRDHLQNVEKALLMHGWIHIKRDEYDQA